MKEKELPYFMVKAIEMCSWSGLEFKITMSRTGVYDSVIYLPAEIKLSVGQKLTFAGLAKALLNES